MVSSEFANKILHDHNKYRHRHKAPDLRISAELNKIAQEWAENLAFNDKFEHRPNNSHGENIYMAGSTDPEWVFKPDKVVKSWYDEIKFYKFGESSPTNSSEVGHFTQLVWKATIELGIGEAKSKAGKVYVVCNYDPPGNVLGEFAKNVIPLDNTVQNEIDDRSSMEDEDSEEAERGRIVLTRSQEKMGIRIVQPNVKIVESMKRLYAVPSEKIRVWSVWLTKVEEEANEWHCWLISHINLLLRMSEYLREAEKLVERENKSKNNEETMIEGPNASMGTRTNRLDDPYRDDDEEQVEKLSGTADAGQTVEGLSRGTRKVIILEPVRFKDADGEIIDGIETERSVTRITRETEDETAVNEVVVSGEVEERLSVAEPMESLSSGSGLSFNVENNGNGNDENRKGTRKSSYVVVTNEESEKIAWPIGVPWQPVDTITVENNEVAENKDDDVKIIPIPRNVKDMLELIRDVNRRATLYESFYKHWQDVADRAVNEIMHRTVMPSERVITNEEIPYFFYVYVEPDIDIGIDNDDQTILLPDETREKITCEFTSLYFNLDDKPGKGGKPWL